MAGPVGLATRLLGAQLLVILLGGITLVIALALIAPGLFAMHLQRTGEDTPGVQLHAQQAFTSSMSIALVLAGIVAAATAALLSWVLSRRVAQPISDLSGAAERVAAGRYDITVPRSTFSRELSTLADSFQAMADQLARTDTARSQLLADLAHEIRTPLATLEAHVDGLQDQVVPPSAESYDVMRAQVARLERLASDIREAAAAQEHALGLRLQPTQVSGLVTAAVRAAEARYQAAAVTLTSADCSGCGTVSVDPDRIQQVLGNLLDNALRHTPPGGQVHLDCAPGPGGASVIEVADTGDGIPPDQLEAVFDRFHRIDPARRGTAATGSGLGLTIARAIVADHGGTLTAHSDGTGAGTTFRITLPAAT
ncbi:MAG TPA: HAMP domain-containing sensor histidine kinase [Candidatus Limnocylindrales bacterium]|nr:HAMP domain-containing sensor histidine kinase [Candidatus Limnocylindrales bacterium]